MPLFPVRIQGHSGAAPVKLTDHVALTLSPYEEIMVEVLKDNGKWLCWVSKIRNAFLSEHRPVREIEMAAKAPYVSDFALAQASSPDFIVIITHAHRRLSLILYFGQSMHVNSDAKALPNTLRLLLLFKHRSPNSSKQSYQAGSYKNVCMYGLTYSKANVLRQGVNLGGVSLATC